MAYFRKRGDKWSFTVDIGLDPVTGKRKQKTVSGFKTKKEAEKACAEIKLQVDNQTYIEPSRMTIEQYMRQWLESKKRSVRSATLSTYSTLTDKHIIPLLGKVELSKLTPLQITKFHNMLQDNGLSDRSILDIHTVLKNALEQAVKWGFIMRNVASLVDRPKISKKELVVWDLYQTQAFLQEAVKDRHYIAFLLALVTGMRQAEILGLRWRDISFESMSISVRQTLDHQGKELRNETKTVTGTRVISIDQSTANELQKHKKMIFAEKLRLGPGYTDHDLVIPTTLGTPISPRNLLRTFYRLIENVGLPKITFHDLRHTHATLLLMQGVHPKIVAERLGHADVRITLNTYSHLLPNMQKDTAAAFGEMFYKDAQK